MEYRNIKGKEYLPPGYIYAPWVTVHSRGRFLDAVDSVILRTLKLINDKWYKSYITRMTSRTHKAVGGGFMVDKKYIDAYKNKKVNPDFYGTVNLSDIPSEPNEQP